MTTEIELPKITDTEELHIALKVFKGKRPLRRFVAEFGLDVLESCKEVVDFIIEEEAEKAKEEELRKQTHIAAFEEAAQSYVDAMAKAGVTLSLDDAKAALSGILQEQGAASTQTSTVRATRGSKEVLTYTLEVNGKTFEKVGLGTKGSFAKLEEDFKAVGATKEEKWKYIAKAELDRFFEQLEAGKLASHIELDEAKEFYGRANAQEVVLDAELEYVLSLDIQTAQEKLGVEMTEDFEFEGKLEDLTNEQEAFLVKISKDGTVEGGVEVIEALD